MYAAACALVEADHARPGTAELIAALPAATVLDLDLPAALAVARETTWAVAHTEYAAQPSPDRPEGAVVATTVSERWKGRPVRVLDLSLRADLPGRHGQRVVVADGGEDVDRGTVGAFRATQALVVNRERGCRGRPGPARRSGGPVPRSRQERSMIHKGRARFTPWHRRRSPGSNRTYSERFGALAVRSWVKSGEYWFSTFGLRSGLHIHLTANNLHWSADHVDGTICSSYTEVRNDQHCH